MSLKNLFRTGSMSTARNASRTDGDVSEDDAPVIIRTTEGKLRLAEQKLLDVQNKNKVPASFLQRNMVVGVIVTFQAVILCFVAALTSDLRLWFTNYTEAESDTPVPEELARINILWYNPIFMINAGMQNLCCVIFMEKYEWYLARHQNPFRWAEYSFSAPLMKVMIAQQVGISDIHLLFAIFIMMVMVIQCGATHESLNAKARADGFHQNWRPFYQAWIAQVSYWLIIVNYFFQSVREGRQEPYMWTIIIVIFLLDMSFAAMFTLQWRMIGPFDDYIVGEEGFMVLSLLSKSALAWLSVANVFT